MALNYDISKYITSVRMSAKKRVLVEGRDDKSRIKKLLDITLGKNEIKIDIADNIKADCKTTAKNNRAKIEKVHKSCKSSPEHSNLYFLCDREFSEFEISTQIVDLMQEHKVDGNLSWTLGHSLENYFIEADLISDAYPYLTDSEYSGDATQLFKDLLPMALKIIAIISLAAKDIDKCSYPLGTIGWNDFTIRDGILRFDIDSWRKGEAQEILVNFRKAYQKYQPIVEASDRMIYARICRGHTAVQLLQRVFSSCLFEVGFQQDEGLANQCASNFSQLNKNAISNALCQAWLKSIEKGSKNYPINLVSSVS